MQFSVMPRTFIGVWILSLCRGAFGEFYSLSWQGRYLDIYLYLQPGRIWHKVFFIMGIKEEGVNTGHKFTRPEGQVQCEVC